MPRPFKPGPLRFRSPTLGLAFNTAPTVASVTPNADRVAGGTTITITGTNFRTSSDGLPPVVRIGSYVATGVVLVSDQILTAVTPAATSAGLFDLTVTVGTQVGTLLGAFTYYSSTISSITPPFGPLAGGTSVLLSGFNFLDPSVAYRNSVLAKNPFGYWRLEEASGTTAVDSATVPHNGTYVGAFTLNVAGGVDGSRATDFLGATGQVTNAASLASINASCTIECWARADSFHATDRRVMFAGRNTSYFGLSEVNGRLFFSLHINGVQQFLQADGSPMDAVTGVWHHYVGTWDGDKLRLYVDGVLIKTSASLTPGVVDWGVGTFRIGAYDGLDPDNFFDGRIDEVAIYPSLLSGAQIAAQYALGFYTLTFGGSPATSVSVIDASHITAVTPSHAVGFVDVVLTEPGGVSSTTFSHGFQYTLLIRGNDIRRSPGINIHDSLNNTPNTASFRIDGRSAQPQIGEQANIVDEFDGNRLLFAGNVQHTDCTYEDKPDVFFWDTQAIDFSGLLNRRYPSGVYENVSVSTIVVDLVTRFAPGFTAAHVQSNLAKVSVTFDGSADFSTCLSTLAAMIGGGHWYVDYFQDVHFFHRTPPAITLPTLPQSALRLGPGNAPVISEGGGISSSQYFAPGFYLFRVSFVYDNGIESAIGPCSNFATLRGDRTIQFTSLPIGPPVGALTCVKRRVYYRVWGSIGTVGFARGEQEGGRIRTGWQKGFEIQDNTTTDLTDANGGSTGVGINCAFGLFISRIPATAPTPFQPYVAPPSNGAPPIIVTVPSNLHQNTVFIPQTPLPAEQPTSFAMGYMKFSVANIYRDGTESVINTETDQIFVGEPNGQFAGLAWSSYLQASNIALGPTIGGVDVVGRVIYGHFLGVGSSLAEFAIPEMTYCWWVIPDNTTTSTPFANVTWAPTPPKSFNPTAFLPPWPNPDGPSLEDNDPPDPITDANVNLLKDPSQQFTVSVDGSQVRNRIIISGGGTTLTAAAVVGATTLSVADTTVFASNGGTIVSGAVSLPYFGVLRGTDANLSGTVYLAAPLGAALQQGTVLTNRVQIDSYESQQLMGKAELDKDGNPTDGVHEFPINDASLITPLQIYMRGYAELELFAFPIVTIRYSTRDPKTKSGQMVHVDLSYPACKGDFLIQDVVIDQIHDESDDLLPRYTVTASSVRFELNDLILQLLTNQNVGSSASAVGLVPAAVAAIPPVTGTIQFATITLTDAQIKVLSGTPIEVIPAPGAGLVISVMSMTAYCHSPVAYLNSRSGDLFYSRDVGGGGGIGTVSALTMTFLVTNVIREEVVVAYPNNNVVYDFNTPAAGKGFPVGKSVFLKASGNNANGDPTNLIKLTIAYMLISGVTS